MKKPTAQAVAVGACIVSLSLVVATAAAPAEVKAPILTAGAFVAAIPTAFHAVRELIRTSHNNNH